MWLKSTIMGAALLLTTQALADVREEENFNFTLDNGGRISVGNVNGSIKIVGGGGDEVQITAFKKANNREALEGIEIIIDARNDSINIETKHPKSRGWFGSDNGGASVSYELSVPTGVNLDGIESVNGGIDIAGVFGDIKADTVNGSIDIEGASGNTRLETVNGGIDVRFASLTGDQRVNCNTVNGKINLTMPRNSDASVSAETMNGGIDGDDFGLKVEKGFVGRDLDGEVGNGSARISLNTVNGGIRIRSN